MRRLAFLLVLLASPAFAAEPAAKPGSYGDRSDEELTALAAEWDSLDRHQRRALLTEMKRRMARNGERNAMIHIRTERRYGRIIRNSDGRVIRIETQVVRERLVDPEELKARQSFGVGFEHRIGRREQAASADPAENAARIAESPASPGAAAGNGEEPSLEDLLESLEPSTRAPVVERLPVYKVSDPER